MNRRLRADALWFFACAVLGFIGTFALLYPLFGFLGYFAGLVFPFLVLAEIAFGVVAVTVKGSWRPVYALGNLGVVAGSLGIFLVELIALAVKPGYQPDPSQWAPAYFGVVLMGLAGGITLAVLRFPTKAE